MDQTDANCRHGNIEYDVGSLVQAGTNVRLTEIAARCADCGVQFRWMGRYLKAPEGDIPYVSEDELWLTLPMIPEDENAFRLVLNEDVTE